MPLGGYRGGTNKVSAASGWFMLGLRVPKFCRGPRFRGDTNCFSILKAMTLTLTLKFVIQRFSSPSAAPSTHRPTTAAQW